MKTGILLTSLLLLVTATNTAGTASAPEALASEETNRSPYLLLTSLITNIRLEVDPAESLKLTNRNRAYAHAVVREGTNVWTDVGIRLKGGSSYRSLEKKPSFAIKFNKFSAGGKYHGVTKVLLGNCTPDDTYLHQYLALSLFRGAGVPAPRAAYARVQFNDRDLGIYLMEEAVNKPFLREHFTRADGNLYEGEARDINGTLEQDGGTRGDQADVKALLQAAQEPDPTKRWAKLQERLDMDRFLRFMAMEMLVGQVNGYTTSAHNYRIYHDPESDKMVFIPHGLDHTFHDANEFIQPPHTSILVAAILHTQEGRREWRRVMGGLVTNVFRVEVLTDRINLAVGALRSAAKGEAEVRVVAERGAALCALVAARAKHVAGAVVGPALQSPQFEAEGRASLVNWETSGRKEQDVLDRVDLDGVKTLHIKNGAGRSSLSWRLPLLLEGGQYRLTGRLRTLGVTPWWGLGGTGAGMMAWLGVPERGRALHFTGDNPWREVTYEFEVPAGGCEVTLLCSLMSVEGEVWFDADSLKLMKLRATDKPQ
jgi:spore coat protein H